MIRQFGRLVLMIAALFSSAAGAVERVVNIFNWSDYIAPKVLEDFTRETGVRVVYDTYDSNEMLDARLLASGAGYDVVVPSATFLARQIRAGAYQPLDKTKLPTNCGLRGGQAGDHEALLPCALNNYQTLLLQAEGLGIRCCANPVP